MKEEKTIFEDRKGCGGVKMEVEVRFAAMWMGGLAIVQEPWISQLLHLVDSHMQM
jgi:hypothetical protein